MSRLDGIHPRILFEFKDYLARSLSILFSASLEFGEVPVDWKDAGITPLFKKGKNLILKIIDQFVELVHFAK